MFPGPLVYGAPWGAMADFDSPLYRSENPVGMPTIGERYLMPKILAGQPIRIFIEASKSDEKQYHKYQSFIDESYNKWFLDTLQIISKAKRTDEFADLIPILQKGIEVEFVGQPQEADIIIKIKPFIEVRLKCGNSAVGCYKRIENKGEIPTILLPEDQFFIKLISGGKISYSRVGLHEMGHSLGLSDQYKEARDENSHRRYASVQSGKGVMSSARNISCDEADGIINLIDIVRGTARGGEPGWKSLCPKADDYYIKGQSALRGPYMITSEDMKNFVLDIYQNGELVSTQTYVLADGKTFPPLEKLRKTVQQRDGLGRPVLAYGAGGEKIYYAYRFEERISMAVKNGKALWVEIDYSVWDKRKKMHGTIFHFQKDGIASVAGIFYCKRKEGTIYYAEEPTAGKTTFEMELTVGKKGRLTEKLRKEEYSPLEGKDSSAEKELKDNPNDRIVSASQIRHQVQNQFGNSRWKLLKEQMLTWFEQATTK